MKTLNLGLSLILILAIGVVPAHAEAPDYGVKGRAPIIGLLNFLQRLDLSQQQKTELATLVKAHREGMRATTDNVRNAFEELRKTVHQDEFDEEAVRISFKSLASAGEELAVERAQLISQVRSLLRDEQKLLIDKAKTKLQTRIKYRLSFARAVFDAWIDHLASNEPENSAFFNSRSTELSSKSKFRDRN